MCFLKIKSLILFSKKAEHSGCFAVSNALTAWACEGTVDDSSVMSRFSPLKSFTPYSYRI